MTEPLFFEDEDEVALQKLWEELWESNDGRQLFESLEADISLINYIAQQEQEQVEQAEQAAVQQQQQDEEDDEDDEQQQQQQQEEVELRLDVITEADPRDTKEKSNNNNKPNQARGGRKSDNTTRGIVLKYLRHSKSGMLIADDIIEMPCFNAWLDTRSNRKGTPQAFREALTAQLQGNSGRTPFEKEAESAILLVLRRCTVWPCALQGGVGTKGFQGMGYHESRDKACALEVLPNDMDQRPRGGSCWSKSSAGYSVGSKRSRLEDDVYGEDRYEMDEGEITEQEDDMNL